jgi:hypothetical protein
MKRSVTTAQGSRVDRSWIVIAAYALLAIFLVPVYEHFPSPNEFTRWLLDASIVERGTIEVSAYAGLLGPRFEDLALVNGRVYSNKAPGCALVALPGYLLARPFAGRPSAASMRASLTAMRLVASTLPLLLLAILFRRAARGLGADDVGASFGTAVLLFALPTFAYGLLLFSHVLVAAALFGAWWALFGSAARGGPQAGAEPGRDATAGALIGLAVLSEYPVVLLGAVLLVGLALSRQWRRVAWVMAGGLPFALILAAYQKAAFGGVAATSYRYEKLPAYHELARTGMSGIQFPSPVILVQILLHPARGLVLFSPIVLLSAAAFLSVQDRLSRPARWTLALVPIAALILYAGYPNWYGGWNLSVRYIVPALPFLAFPFCFLRQRGPGAALFGASVAAIVLTAMSFPFVPLEFPLPWGTLAAPLLANGAVVPSVLGSHAPGLTMAVAVVLVCVALGAAVERRQLGYLAAGIALSVAAGLVSAWATRDHLLQHVERGYIEDVYFGHRGALERSLPPGMAVPPGLRQRRAYELRIPPEAR